MAPLEEPSVKLSEVTGAHWARRYLLLCRARSILRLRVWTDYDRL